MPPRTPNKVIWTLSEGRAQFWLLRGLYIKQADFFCHLGDNLQTAITVAKNSEMIPRGSRVILVEANEPEEFVPASLTWQLVEKQENGPEKNVSKCQNGLPWPGLMEYSAGPGQPSLSIRIYHSNNPWHLSRVLQFAKHLAFLSALFSPGCTQKSPGRVCRSPMPRLCRLNQNVWAGSQH